MYQSISPPITSQCSPVNFGTALSAASESVTNIWLLSTYTWMSRLSGWIKSKCSTSEHFATMSSITGSIYYNWQNLDTITYSTISNQWCTSVQTTTTILQCSSNQPKLPVQNVRCQQTVWWPALMRLTGFFRKLYWRLMSSKYSTIVGKKWLLLLEAKCGFLPQISEHLGLSRNTITMDLSRIQSVWWWIRMLTNNNCGILCKITLICTFRF